jgi:L-threonylcarbamoyladenylate synthase
MNMKTHVIDTDQPDAVQQALGHIQSGGVIAFPTDTVYGLGSSPFNPEAITKLFTIKGRDFNKAISILISDISQLPLLSEGFPLTADLLAKRFWPGALTIIVNKKKGLPANLSPFPSIGIRIPDHAFALHLLQVTGPLAVTSANRSGGRDPLTAKDVLEQLDGRFDLLMDGGRCPGGIPSTVIDCTLPEIKFFRIGAILEETIKKALP